MTRDEYIKVIEDALKTLGQFINQRAAAEAQIPKLGSFIQATANLLPDAERDKYLQALKNLQQESMSRSTSLSDVIRKILEAERGKWLTVSEVRDRLIALGFDFSGYTSNPLASVSATLKRMHPREVETSDMDGATGYRLKQRKPPPPPVPRSAPLPAPAKK